MMCGCWNWRLSHIESLFSCSFKIFYTNCQNDLFQWENHCSVSFNVLMYYLVLNAFDCLHLLPVYILFIYLSKTYTTHCRVSLPDKFSSKLAYGSIVLLVPYLFGSYLLQIFKCLFLTTLSLVFNFLSSLSLRLKV